MADKRSTADANPVNYSDEAPIIDDSTVEDDGNEEQVSGSNRTYLEERIAVPELDGESSTRFSFRKLWAFTGPG